MIWGSQGMSGVLFSLPYPSPVPFFGLDPHLSMAEHLFFVREWAAMACREDYRV